MSRKKKMDIGEFVEFGYLQEVNRRYFHPLGLELTVCEGERPIQENGEPCTLDDVALSLPVVLDCVWDRRNSTKVLLSKVDLEKAERVACEIKARRRARRALPECNSSGFQKVPRG